MTSLTASWLEVSQRIRVLEEENARLREEIEHLRQDAWLHSLWHGCSGTNAPTDGIL